MSLFRDLRRRHVFRLAGLYIVGAWVVIEVSSVFFPAWGIPDTALRYLFVAAALLFPVALIFSWIFDVTSNGIVRTEAAAPGEEVDLKLQRSDFLMLAGLAIVGFAVLAGSFQKIAEEIEIVDAIVQRVENSVAVLPFSNLDTSADTGYFSDGVTEEILHRLSATRALHVFGSTSSFAFRNSEDSPARISEVLGVEYLLHGSIRRDNNFVRVTARLLDQQGLQVWSQSFDRKLEAIFVIQSEIASAVAAQIVKEIVSTHGASQARATDNMDAYNAYLVGRAFANAREK
jgi:TolB-like protein